MDGKALDELVAADWPAGVLSSWPLILGAADGVRGLLGGSTTDWAVGLLADSMLGLLADCTAVCVLGLLSDGLLADCTAVCVLGRLLDDSAVCVPELLAGCTAL